MRRRALVCLLPSLCSCLDVSTDAPSPYWIISCNESRMPDEMLYLQDSKYPGDNWRMDDDTGILQSWKMDYRSPDASGKFLLYPSDTEGAYYLVGAYESVFAGYMLYLDSSGVAQPWPFDPEQPDKEAEWRIIPYDETKKTYFIVAGEHARYPEEMLFLTGFLGNSVLDTWHYDPKQPDAKATFAFYRAPPSPPVDYKVVNETHTRLLYVFRIMIPIVFVCVCCCLSADRNRNRVNTKDTSFTASVFAFPAAALAAMPWNRAYERVP